MVELDVVGADLRLVLLIQVGEHLPVVADGLPVLVDEVELELEPDRAVIVELGRLERTVEDLQIIAQPLPVTGPLLRRVLLGGYGFTHGSEITTDSWVAGVIYASGTTR